MWHCWRMMWQRDWLLIQRRQADWINPLIFYVIIAAMFPLSLPHNDAILQTIGAGVIWISALLAGFLSLESMFRTDFQEGVIEQWLLSSIPLWQLVACRMLTHWIFCGLPIVLCSPLLALMYHLSFSVLLALMLGLLMGMWVIAGIGAFGMGITVGLPQAGLLLAIIVLPLYIPVLILGNVMAMFASMGMNLSGLLALMLAMDILTAILAPFATAAALKVSMS